MISSIFVQQKLTNGDTSYSILVRSEVMIRIAYSTQ